VIVADASIVVKALVAEPGSEQALAALQMANKVIAPALMFTEVANVLRRKERLGLISSEQSVRATEHLLLVPDQTVPDNELITDAMTLARQMNHSVYDCVYLAASIQSGAVILTADDVFRVKADQNGFGHHVMTPPAWMGRPPVAAEDLSRAAAQYEETLRHIEDLRRPEPTDRQISIDNAQILGTPEIFDSFPYQTMLKLLREIDPNERARLLALAWIGRGYGHTHWPSLYANALESAGVHFEQHADYFIPLMKYVQLGLEKFGDVADFRILRFPDDN